MDTFKKDLGPVYIRFIGPAPDFAYHIYDELNKYGDVINGGQEFTDEQKEQILNLFPQKNTIVLSPGEEYKIPTYKSALVEITTTDPKCTFTTYSGDDSVILGAGVFTFVTYLTCFTGVFIQHDGPFDVKFYDIPNEYKEILSELFLNCSVPGPELWGYNNSCFGRNRYTEQNSKLAGTYTKKFRYLDTTSGWIYSDTIEELQRHPELFEKKQEWGLSWDENLIRQSNPPCIGLSVKGKHLEDIMSFAVVVCPDATFSGFDKYDFEEIPQPEDDVARQRRENFDMKIKVFEKLLATGFIYQ